MIAISVAVAGHVADSGVYPFMSHESLCIALERRYDPRLPFFCMALNREGLLKFNLWRSVGDLASEAVCQPPEALAIFDLFLGNLKALNAQT